LKMKLERSFGGKLEERRRDAWRELRKSDIGRLPLSTSRLRALPIHARRISSISSLLVTNHCLSRRAFYQTVPQTRRMVGFRIYAGQWHKARNRSSRLRYGSLNDRKSHG
jgi:hypothetical protein